VIQHKHQALLRSISWISLYHIQASLRKSYSYYPGKS